MSADRTTEQIMWATFGSEDGLRTAGGLAVLGKLFLNQPLQGQDDIVRCNLAKQFLHQAGFMLRLVREDRAREPVVVTEKDLDAFLEGQEGETL